MLNAHKVVSEDDSCVDIVLWNCEDNCCCVCVYRYTAACSKLLVQIKAAFIQLSDDEYPSVEEFVRKCKVFSCLFVVKTGLKLLNVGVTHNNTSDCGANVVSG